MLRTAFYSGWTTASGLVYHFLQCYISQSQNVHFSEAEAFVNVTPISSLRVSILQHKLKTLRIIDTHSIKTHTADHFEHMH